MIFRIGAAFFAFALFAHPGSAESHGGGLDANGCHTKRATGEYHCHRAQSSEKSPATVKPANAAKKPVSSDQCFTGPRGGRYRIVNGKKRYDCV